MTKIYFAAAMRGDRSNLGDDKKIIEGLKQLGYRILTEWVVDDVLDIERGATPEEIFERDVEMLDKCDVLVADISYPSLGVGFEIAYTLLNGKPVIAFCREDRVEKTSALIRGVKWSNFRLVIYSNVDELLKILDKKLKEFKKACF